MSITCKIEFEDNPQKVFCAGGLLQGTAELNFKIQKSVRSGSIELQPGTYKFTFEFTLPHQLPSSIEGDCGHIRYVAKVVCDMPMWVDKKFEEPFTVIRPTNLRETLRNPVVVGIQEKIVPCFFSCSNPDPVTITARMPFGGYNSGESINLEINVENISNHSFYEFTAELIRWREETMTLSEETTGGCDGNQRKTIRINIEIPKTPPTDTTIVAVTPPFYTTPTVDIPIIIGSNRYQIDTMPKQPDIKTIQEAPATPNIVIAQPPSSAQDTLEPKY
ncbi:arrestin domain-containing protein 17-like [Sitodiplosis mosellana]|uniref:arrestin domain-containing protein 17-like n=1 Tax=Sitodiplosis mosellana TaxID=263140 RepID=UPI002444C161|nr:arrestin domain-containing protein 17-like [Sitodiplosis mosellana]